jgi:hypothetical protein
MGGIKRPSHARGMQSAAARAVERMAGVPPCYAGHERVRASGSPGSPSVVSKLCEVRVAP